MTDTDKLNKTANLHCTCGGAGPGEGCGVCEVYHAARELIAELEERGAAGIDVTIRRGVDRRHDDELGLTGRNIHQVVTRMGKGLEDRDARIAELEDAEERAVDNLRQSEMEGDARIADLEAELADLKMARALAEAGAALAAARDKLVELENQNAELRKLVSEAAG